MTSGSHPQRDIVLTCCRDEVDVIETFIRFHLAMGFDAVYVVDNGSIDGTVERVERLVAQGFPVILRRDHRLGYERHLTEYFSWAGEDARPRWIFFLDADEFILFPEGSRTFLDALDERTTCLRIRTREMYPFPGDDRRRNHHFLLSTRVGAGFVDVTKDIARWVRGAEVRSGKHRIDFASRVVRDAGDIFIRHYKYRSPDQARRKEANRVQSESTYTDTELLQFSAFDLATTRDWISHCQREAEAEGWKSWFNADLPCEQDDDLARWATTFLASAMDNA